MDTDTEAFKEIIQATAALAVSTREQMLAKGLPASSFDVAWFLGKVLVGEDLWNSRPDVRSQWSGVLRAEVERRLSLPKSNPDSIAGN
jgi:hypothetical protein